jgi:hypothetical protein
MGMGFGIILVLVLVIGTSMAATGDGSLQGALVNLIVFFNDYVIPLLLGLAFLFFVWNAVRFFILGGAQEEGREKAKMLALYGIGAFVFIASIWGIVNLLIGGLGFSNNQAITPDYQLSTPFRRDNFETAERCRDNPRAADCQ